MNTLDKINKNDIWKKTGLLLDINPNLESKIYHILTLELLYNDEVLLIPNYQNIITLIYPFFKGILHNFTVPPSKDGIINTIKNFSIEYETNKYLPDEDIVKKIISEYEHTR